MGKRLLLMFALLFAVGLGLVLLPVGTASAQEVCDNGVDDNKDGLVDCRDPLCFESPKCKVPPPPTGTPCSPGFWKTVPHRAEFLAACDDAAALAAFLGITRLDTCDELLAAVSCQGADATCLRSLAASLLNTVSSCVE
jgi:hypothetical protein